MYLVLLTLFLFLRLLMNSISIHIIHTLDSMLAPCALNSIYLLVSVCLLLLLLFLMLLSLVLFMQVC